MSGWSRRRRWLVLSAPIWLLALVVSVKLLTMVGSNHAGREAYTERRMAEAKTAFDRTLVLNVAERWVAPFNRGTTHFQLRRYAEARADLEAALAVVPATSECRVRLNLAATWEAIGDDHAAGQRPGEARAAYEAGLVALGGCARPQNEPTPTPSASPSPGATPTPSPGATPTPSPGATPSPTPGGSPTPSAGGSPSPGGSPSSGQSSSPGATGSPSPNESGEPEQTEEERRREESERAREAEERLGEKRDEQARAEGREPSGTPTPQRSPEASDGESSDAKQARLEKQNEEAAKDRQQNRDRDTPREPDVKKPY